MIQSNNKSITSLFYVDLVISKVAKGTVTLWEKILSCFSSGLWKEDRPWINSEIWKNN